MRGQVVCFCSDIYNTRSCAVVRADDSGTGISERHEVDARSSRRCQKLAGVQVDGDGVDEVILQQGAF